MKATSIIQTQSNFKIYHEGQPDTMANIGLKFERIAYTKVLPAIDKIDYYFTHHTLDGYNS
jgi:hypothetical protein